MLQHLVEEPMLAAICAGVLDGIGLGLVLRVGGSTGGIDVPAMILNRKLGWKLATVMSGIDIAIFLLQIPITKPEGIILGILYALVYSVVMDRMIVLEQGGYQIMIWTEKLSEVNEDLITGFDTAMSKADMLDYHVSAMNHAMCITGVNLDEDGNPNRWKIENSWGDGGANKGYHMASDAWFDKFVFQAVVNRKYLGDKAGLLDQPLTELAPWDPMGSLAD